MPAEIMDREFVYSGHVGCAGCGAAIAMRFVLKALGEKTIMVLPACCWSVITGSYPLSALKIPVIHAAFETGGATASGVRAALDMKGDTETTVLTWAGDGGTFDIGFQALSGAVERNENFLYVCYDNEAYMNTGIQRSSSTPYGAWTTTTTGQDWKRLREKKYRGSPRGPPDSLCGDGQYCFSRRLAPQDPEGKGNERIEISSYLCELPHGLAHPLRNVRQDRPHGRTDQYLSPL